MKRIYNHMCMYGVCPIQLAYLGLVNG